MSGHTKAPEKNPKQLSKSLETAAAAIADRCASDPEWMAKFKADPRQVLQEATGRELPANLQIHVHQNDKDNWHVPISDGDAKLRDEDLHKVAGGEIFIVAMLGMTAAGLGTGVAVAGAATGIGITVDKKKRSGKK